MLKGFVAFAFLLTSCGYHLVGQGDGSVFPQEVNTATLQSNASLTGKAIAAELNFIWQQRTSLPTLEARDSGNKEHAVVRIEQENIVFTPVGFDASGLAMQYRLQLSAILKMYQQDALIWQSGSIMVYADVFGASDPSVTEAERERLTEQLYKTWAKEALARLQSGF